MTKTQDYSQKIELGTRSYDIAIKPGLLANPALAIAPFVHNGRAFMVMDSNMAALYQQQLRDSFDAQNITLFTHIISAGEDSKNWQNLQDICGWMLDNEIERKDILIAFGGGVTGDLTGFAASMIKRGCRFLQIPTSLLAQVDSSVGGKTAINTKQGKNLVGAFYQPVHVAIDPDILNSLPDRHMRAGYAEVVKYGLINDRAFFYWLEEHGTDILNRKSAPLCQAIATSVASKANIVAQDERETANVRALLNLGHSFGHALEREKNYSDALFHGEAVAIGMVLAFGFSVKMGICPKEDYIRVKKHLSDVGLPTNLNDAQIAASGEALVDHMRHDKKVSAGKLPLILAKGIGQSYVDGYIALDDVADYLNSDEARGAKA